jgi:hypothetical protein
LKGRTVNEQQAETDKKTRPVGSRRMVPIAASVAVVIAVVLYQTRPGMISPLGAILALMTCAVGMLPTLFYVLRDDRTIPFFPAVGLFQVFCFGLSPFLLPLAWPDAPPIEYWGGRLTLTSESIETLALVLVGTLALVAMFFLVRRAGLGWLPVPRIRERAGGNASLVLLSGLTLAHLAYKFFPGLSRIPSIGQFLEPVGYVVFSAFLILLLKRKTRGLYTVLAVLALVLLAAVRIETFNFTQLMIPCLCVVAALVYTRAYRLASLLGVLLVLSLPAYELTSTVRYTQGGFMKKAEQFVLTVDGYIKGARRDGATSATQSAVRRISHAWLFTHVVQKSPEQVPFWGGETYKPLFTAMIPRVIWPNKPLEITGGLFGKRYDLLKPTSQTSLNLPWHIETYANFGSLGVVIGMALIGAFLAVLDKLLNAPGRRELEIGLGLGILIPLTFQDSNFSLMVGTLPQFVLCLYIFFLIGEFVLRRLGMGSGAADQE